MRARQTTRIASVARYAEAMLCVALFLAAAPLFAHHSIPAYFYTDQKNTIEGNVASFDYRNPHSFLHVEVEDAKTGQKQMWDVEWSSIRRLENQGVTKDTLKPGDHVKIVAYPSRKVNDHVLHMVSVVRPSDGWKWGRELQQ
jgi:hypothetical protein